MNKPPTKRMIMTNYISNFNSTYLHYLLYYGNTSRGEMIKFPLVAEPRLLGNCKQESLKYAIFQCD